MLETAICFYLKEGEEVTLGDYLQKHFKISKQKLKKANLTKVYLAQKIVARKCYYLPLWIFNQHLIAPIDITLAQKLNIILENEFFIAVSKPNGWHNYPLHYGDSINVLGALRTLGRCDILQLTEDEDRGLLYRLDFETSGVLILAKDPALLLAVRQNFNQVIIRKEYVCACVGELRENATWRDILESYGPAGSMVRVKNNPTGFGTPMGMSSQVNAELSFQVLKYDEKMNRTWCRVQLITGFRHQIRVQFAARGFPLVGDALYGTPEQRLYLHCSHYELKWHHQVFQITDQSWPVNSTL